MIGPQLYFWNKLHQSNYSNYLVFISFPHLGHHVELHRHGDDVESDDGRDGQVEVLAGDDVVQRQAGRRVVSVVGRGTHLYKNTRKEIKDYYFAVLKQMTTHSKIPWFFNFHMICLSFVSAHVGGCLHIYSQRKLLPHIYLFYSNTQFYSYDSNLLDQQVFILMF